VYAEMTRRRSQRQYIVFRQESRYSHHGPSDGEGLQVVKDLQETFDGIFDGGVLLDVLEDCNYDRQRAMEVLFEMAPQAAPAHGNARGEQCLTPSQGAGPLSRLPCMCSDKECGKY
jgi:hypothetical protein